MKLHNGSKQERDRWSRGLVNSTFFNVELENGETYNVDRAVKIQLLKVILISETCRPLIIGC